jgi:hypothetical protein
MTKTTEKRTAPIGLRILPSVKEALEKAAESDHRPVASMVEKILIEWLREKGFLAGGKLETTPAEPSPAKPAGKKPKA